MIFSKLLEKLLKHLYNIFQELTKTRIILQPTKSFFAYPSVHFLRQRVNAFSIATAEAKLAAIKWFAFPHSLKDLKAYLGLTEYLKQYILYYAQVFQERKTLLNCSVNVRGNACQKVVARMYIITATNQELNTFYHLQQFFLRPSILLH